MSGPAGYALVALLAPALVFVVLAVLAPLRRSGRPAAYLSVLGALTSLVFAVLAWRAQGSMGDATEVWAWLPAQGAALASVGVLADGQSMIMLLLVALVALLVQVYSLGYLAGEPDAALGRYYAYQSLFAFSMMGLVLAPNFLQMFICWELVGLCSYLLIGFWYQKPSAARAAVKAFWTTKLGDVGFLIGIVLLWQLAGTFDFGELQQWAASQAVGVAGLGWITFCIYLGAAGKSAQFPLHIWLPDAMEGPTPVSALIHAATMVTAGVYLLTRTAFLFTLTPDVLAVVAWVGAGTALMAAILACVQDDIKRVLAYSTVSQLGYMMAAIGAGYAAAGFLHLLTHGVFKALLFLGAGAVIHGVGTNDITHMGGLARRMPQTMVVFVIGTLSLAGIPLFAGFLSKELILAGVLAGGFTVPFVMLLVGAFLTAFYMIRVVALAFFGSARTPAAAHDSHGHGHAHGHPHDPPISMALPLWILALMSVAIGAYFTLNHGEPTIPAPAWLTPAAIGAGVGGVLIAWLAYQMKVVDAAALARAFGPIRTAALRGFWVDQAFLGAYRGVVLMLSRAIGWLDRYIVDGVVNVVSAWTVMLGDGIRRVQTGRVQDYVTGVAVGVLILLWWLGGAS